MLGALQPCKNSNILHRVTTYSTKAKPNTEAVFVKLNKSMIQ